MKKRILWKLSGEVLGGPEGPLSPSKMVFIIEELKEVVESYPQLEMGMVIGGGNIFRGAKGEGIGFSRVEGDKMGMLATVINGLSMADLLNQSGLKTKVFTPFKVSTFTEEFSLEKVETFYQNGGKIAIFSGGLGHPYFSTDTVCVVRALEIGAQKIYKATKVAGVYEEDPINNPQAKRYQEISYSEVLEKRLRVMDMTAFSLARDNNLEIIIFDSTCKGNFRAVLENYSSIGTLVH